MYLLVSYGFPVLERHLPQSRYAPSELQLTYLDGRGILRQLLAVCGEHGFAVADVAVRRTESSRENGRTVTLALKVHGGHSLTELAGDLDGIDGVLSVSAEGAGALAGEIE
jgi:putative Mg2+ transporter-C (MgtC) family protein